jgi:PKD repeat protein
MKYLSIIGLGLLAITSCTKPSPTACFTFSRTTVKVDDTITLVNCSKNFDNNNVEWTLPDGGKSSAINPRIKFNKSGIYNVRLRVGTENFKQEDNAFGDINVFP